MSPSQSFLQTFLEFLSMGLWRLVSLIVVGGFYSTIRGLDTAVIATKVKGVGSIEEKNKPE